MVNKPAYSSALHAVGPGFEPQRNHIEYLAPPVGHPDSTDLLLTQQFLHFAINILPNIILLINHPEPIRSFDLVTCSHTMIRLENLITYRNYWNVVFCWIHCYCSVKTLHYRLTHIGLLQWSCAGEKTQTSFYVFYGWPSRPCLLYCAAGLCLITPASLQTDTSTNGLIIYWPARISGYVL